VYTDAIYVICSAQTAIAGNILYSCTSSLHTNSLFINVINWLSVDCNFTYFQIYVSSIVSRVCYIVHQPQSTQHAHSIDIIDPHTCAMHTISNILTCILHSINELHYNDGSLNQCPCAWRMMISSLMILLKLNNAWRISGYTHVDAHTMCMPRNRLAYICTHISLGDQTTSSRLILMSLSVVSSNGLSKFP
jgi:hypothetical protein